MWDDSVARIIGLDTVREIHIHNLNPLRIPHAVLAALAAVAGRGPAGVVAVVHPLFPHGIVRWLLCSSGHLVAIAQIDADGRAFNLVTSHAKDSQAPNTGANTALALRV